MTEDDARKKWCPFVMNNTERGSGGCNRNGRFREDQEQFLCIGSDCACWQWDQVAACDNPTGLNTTIVVGGVPASIRTIDSETNGKCGLVTKQ